MPISQSQSIAQERAAETADSELNLIARLLDSEPFAKYYVRRLKQRRQALREHIADDDSLSDNETKTLRRLVKEYDALLRMPEEDQQIHSQTLRSLRTEQTGPSRG